jgi:hypothetical protein
MDSQSGGGARRSDKMGNRHPTTVEPVGRGFTPAKRQKRAAVTSLSPAQFPPNEVRILLGVRASVT